MSDTMLTTVDNPFDPFTQYDEWYQWDETAGYNTNNFLARVVITSDDLSESDQQLAIDRAMQEIIQENVLGIYKIVSSNDSSITAVEN